MSDISETHEQELEHAKWRRQDQYAVCDTSDEAVVKRLNQAVGLIDMHMARRQWTCSECGNTIHRGEWYLRLGRREQVCCRCLS